MLTSLVPPSFLLVYSAGLGVKPSMYCEELLSVDVSLPVCLLIWPSCNTSSVSDDWHCMHVDSFRLGLCSCSSAGSSGPVSTVLGFGWLSYDLITVDICLQGICSCLGHLHCFFQVVQPPVINLAFLHNIQLSSLGDNPVFLLYVLVRWINVSLISGIIFI